MYKLKMEHGLIFLLGLAAGATGLVAASRGKIKPRETLAGLVAGGMDVKDKVVSVIDRGREELEDMVAEAEHLRQTTATKPKPEKA